MSCAYDLINAESGKEEKVLEQLKTLNFVEDAW